MKTGVSTAVLALIWTASAHAQVAEPTPTPAPQAPPQYGQPTAAPTPYGYPPPQAPPTAAPQGQYYPASPAPAPSPYSYPAGPAPAPSPYALPPTTEAAAAPAQTGRSSGFHLALGLGFAGTGRPGIATQFKIGGRLSPSLTLYYYALNNWYPTFPGPNKHWRISAVNGVGVDYFVVPKLGGRFGIGLGSDAPEDWSNSNAKPRYLGYSYFMGLTWEVLDSRSHFSIDPVINVLQLSENSTWHSYADFLLTLNWVYN